MLFFIKYKLFQTFTIIYVNAIYATFEEIIGNYPISIKCKLYHTTKYLFLVRKSDTDLVHFIR